MNMEKKTLIDLADAIAKTEYQDLVNYKLPHGIALTELEYAIVRYLDGKDDPEIEKLAEKVISEKKKQLQSKIEEGQPLSHSEDEVYSFPSNVADKGRAR